MLGHSALSEYPLGAIYVAAGGVTNYADNLSKGTYTITGQSVTDAYVVAPIVYADSLSAGSYVITGKTISDLLAKNDSLSEGTYTLTGQSITDRLGVNTQDSLTKGTYTYTGQQITDMYVGAPVVYADTLSKGTYTYTGQSITDLYAHNDSLSAGSYTYTGKDIADSLGVNTQDSLSVGSYIITGQSITDTKTGLMHYADDLSAGSYAYTGQSIQDDYIPLPIVTSGTKGAFSPTVKARKFKKADRDDIIQAIKVAIECEPVADEQIEDIVVSVAKELKPRDFASEIAQYEYAIHQTRVKIQAIIDAETDDEEALLLLL